MEIFLGINIGLMLAVLVVFILSCCNFGIFGEIKKYQEILVKLGKAHYDKDGFKLNDDKDGK